jgi:hypothetical protein
MGFAGAGGCLGMTLCGDKKPIRRSAWCVQVVLKIKASTSNAPFEYDWLRAAKWEMEDGSD